MPPKPKPDPRYLAAILTADDTVTDEEKLQFARILSGQDLHTHQDEHAEKVDWLQGKFEAQAHRRREALIQANARRHAFVIGFAVVFMIVSMAVVAQLHML
jgi:hypothetical protein